jgi:predicted HicB family RNase H-like nuclease
MKKGGDPDATITPKEKVKRMSLIIKPELHRAFKVACAAAGKEMTEVLIEFIEQYVQEHRPTAARPSKKAGRA